jgi:hypothetical protein
MGKELGGGLWIALNGDSEKHVPRESGHNLQRTDDRH